MTFWIKIIFLAVITSYHVKNLRTINKSYVSVLSIPVIRHKVKLTHNFAVPYNAQALRSPDQALSLNNLPCHAHNRPQGPKGVPGRLRSRIFLTFSTTRVVARQPHAPAAFTPRGNPWYSFLEAESTPGHMVPSVATEQIPSVTPPGIDTLPCTV
jgi:hypothetical protein